MKTKQLQIAGLSALIVMIWGYVGYTLLNPPKAYLGEHEIIAMEFMLTNACPFLREQYNALEIDGKIEWQGAADIAEECKRRVESAQFEQVLINEFSRHYSE